MGRLHHPLTAVGLCHNKYPLAIQHGPVCPQIQGTCRFLVTVGVIVASLAHSLPAYSTHHPRLYDPPGLRRSIHIHHAAFYVIFILHFILSCLRFVFNALTGLFHINDDPEFTHKKGNKSFSPLSQISDGEALTRTWKVCTKVASHLEQGQRLENLSWRLWFLQIALVQADNAKQKREFKKFSKGMGEKLDKDKGRWVHF